MSLKPCPECKTEISTSASVCPKCGAAQKKRMGGCAITILVVFGFLVLIYVITAVQVSNRPKPQTAVEPTVACDVSKIEIKSIKAQFVNECRNSPCVHFKGVAVLTNRCDVPVGVQLKITALDRFGAPMAVNELWPASTRNIAPGDYTFSVDHWLDYEPGIERFELEPIEVRQWRDR